MAVYKILDNFFEPTFAVIAIHSYLEDYRLAYLLNLNLRSKLNRLPFNIDFKDKTSFSLYEWEDKDNDAVWNLISNKSNANNQMAETVSENLFNLKDTPVMRFLIPERNKVDYFLKIDNGSEIIGIDKTLVHINQIEQISTAYKLDIESLKSRNNLIF